ncbi:Virion structural protein (plasmid) [Bacillus thuringiensis MC28]|nr:Virion structural protein [Bacillus thuringiensis MC28]
MESQLGKNLLQPEPGWAREYCTLENAKPGKFFSNVDLTNNITGDKWRAVGDTNRLEQNSAWYVGDTLGRSFYFKFTGNAVRILLKNFTTHAYNIEVTIDGIRYPGSVPAYSAGYSLVVFEKLDLIKGEHNVKVTTNGYASGAPGITYTFLAAIDYADLGAKVGDALLQPETGWNRFDDLDKSIKYIGDYWVVYQNGTPAYYNSSAHIRPHNKPGQHQIQFTFTGTGLRLIGANSNNVDFKDKLTQVTIDGVQAGTFQMYQTTLLYQCIQFEKLNLPTGVHTVTISTDALHLDAVDIQNGELISQDLNKKTKVSLYEKESGKLFVDDFDSVNPKWLMSPSNSFNNAVKKGFLRMNHSTDKDVMLLIDKPQSNFAIQVIADYSPAKEGDAGGLLIYQNEKNKVEFLESYSSNSSQSNKEWMAICKEDQWDFYTKTDTFFDYADNDSLAAKRIGVVLKRGNAEGFVPLDINKIIMTTSNMLRLRQLYENYKVVLKDTADNILSTNIVAAAHTGIDILLPSLEFEGIIEIYDEENELLAKKRATFYGGDMYCMGSSLQIKMDSAELNTTDSTNLGYMVNNERIVKMTIVNDNIGAATNIKLSIQQYMEKVGYTWTLISLDGFNYSDELAIETLDAGSSKDFFVKITKDVNYLAFEPIYFNIHLLHK